jgi:hypothetical protein
MKTTVDLPDDLVKELKLRAIHEGKKLKDTVADMLRVGLAAPRGSGGSGGSRTKQRAVVRNDRKTGTPVIQCPRAAPRGKELTPDRASQILISREAGSSDDLG